MLWSAAVPAAACGKQQQVVPSLCNPQHPAATGVSIIRRGESHAAVIVNTLHLEPPDVHFDQSPRPVVVAGQGLGSGTRFGRGRVLAGRGNLAAIDNDEPLSVPTT